MLKDVDKMQQLGKNLDTAMKSFGAMSTGFQAIAVELAKSLDNHMATTEKLAFVNTAYEGFVATQPRLANSMPTLRKELYKPIEGVIGRKPFGS